MTVTTAARLITGVDMPAPELLPLGTGRLALFSSRGPEKTVNEDAAAWIPANETTDVLAVADGLGGQPAGDRAARLAVESLATAIADAGDAGTGLREAILDGFERANRAIRELRLGAGSTLAVVEVRGRHARTYHVGDSEILIVGQRGKRRLQTVSHSPTGHGVEGGFLDEREAMHHEDRHLLTNLLGVEDMRITIGPVLTLRPRDTVVLGSDGLFDNLHVSEIVDLARKGDLAKQASRMAERCRDRMTGTSTRVPGKPDDLTFLVYRPKPSPPEPKRAIP